jgi:hypothetical protein
MSYPVTNQYVVVEEICTYAGTDATIRPRVTAKVTPCFVMNQSTCKNTTPRITNWVKPQDVPGYTGQAITQLALGAMDNNPLYQICMANLLFFGGLLNDQSMTDAMMASCITVGTAGSVYLACEAAWNINNGLNAAAATAAERQQIYTAAVFRSWATAWGAAAGVICATPRF